MILLNNIRMIKKLLEAAILFMAVASGLIS